FVARDLSRAAACYDRLLELGPPRNFSAQATYESAVAWAAQGAVAEAEERFRDVADHYADELSEGGQPLRALALFHLAKLQPQKRYGQLLGAQFIAQAHSAFRPDACAGRRFSTGRKSSGQELRTRGEEAGLASGMEKPRGIASNLGASARWIYGSGTAGLCLSLGG